MRFKDGLIAAMAIGATCFCGTVLSAPTKNPWGGGQRYDYELCETNKPGNACAQVTEYASLEEARGAIASTCRGHQPAPWSQDESPEIVQIRSKGQGLIQTVDCSAASNR